MAASTSLLSVVAILAALGCGNDRGAVDAHHTLGTQLGSEPRGAAAYPGARRAASADDLATARRYLEATLRLDPTNEAALTALAGLGGVPADERAPMGGVPLLGPSASRTPAGQGAASLTRVAFGEVGTFSADVAAALAPWAVLPRVSLPVARGITDSAGAIATIVAERPPAPDSASRETVASGRSRGRARTVAYRHPAPAPLSLAADSTSALGEDDSVSAPPAAISPHKHKRTWPWTRAQRWLVAKGIGGGAGAGVVVGAIVGNVPGAILAGSIGGGALGFKKATKIGPADPYPSARDSASFAAAHP